MGESLVLNRVVLINKQIACVLVNKNEYFCPVNQIKNSVFRILQLLFIIKNCALAIWIFGVAEHAPLDSLCLGA